MKKIIYFDIDNTLIRTHELSLKFYKQFAEELNVSVEKIVRIKEKYKETIETTTDYNPDDLANFIGRELSVDIKKIRNPFLNQSLYKDIVYPEVVEVLDKLSVNFELGIFSEGFVDYQIQKLKFTGLLKFFDKKLVVIERRKLANKSINKLKLGNVIVDDKQEVVERLIELKNKNFKIVWVNRLDNKTIDGLTTVKSLSELNY